MLDEPVSYKIISKFLDRQILKKEILRWAEKGECARRLSFKILNLNMKSHTAFCITAIIGEWSEL